MPDLYIVRAAGDCMLPEIKNGGAVIVDKHAKYETGDLILLFFRPEVVPAGGFQVIIKRLAMTLPPWVKKFPYTDHPHSDVKALVVVEMNNPRRQFAYPCNMLLGIHKCLGPVPKDAKYDAKTRLWSVPSLARLTKKAPIPAMNGPQQVAARP